MGNNPLTIAKWYIEIGWSLIPILPDSKVPAIKWTEFQNRRATLPEVEGWLSKGWFLAVVTGDISGIIVIDDDRTKNGLKEWGFTSPVSSKTQNNGKHFFSKYDREIHSHTNGKLHIDLKAWHSYVLLPPFNNREWINKPTRENLAKLTPIEDDTVRLINSDTRESNGESKPVVLSDLMNITDGSRNDSLYRLACSLFQKEKEEDALRLLAGVNQTYTPPLSDKEFNYQVSRAKEFIKKKTSDTNMNAGLPYKGDSVLSSVPVLIGDLDSTKLAIDWIWEGYLAKGHLTFFSALWKVGKSTLISHLLKKLQSGEDFIGQSVKPCKTLILSEESQAEWCRRREDLELFGYIYLDCRSIITKLNTNEWLAFIEKNVKFCEEKGIELVIIDTISTFWPVRDEGNNPELDAALIPLNAFLVKNISVMLIHHFRKSGGTEGTATRGGGGLGSRADILLEFTRKEAENVNSTQRVLKSYSRFEETPQELVIELVNNEYKALGTVNEVSKEAKYKILMNTMQEQNQPLTITEIVDSWDIDSYGKTPTNRTIRRYIDALLKDGRVLQGKTKMVGKTEAPTYTINNVRQDSIISNKTSFVKEQQLTPEKLNFDEDGNLPETLI